MQYQDEPSCDRSIELCLITSNFNLVYLAQQAGIERIMVDLERLGKAERQAGQNLFLSDHHEEDVQILRQILVKSALMVRINPLNQGSQAEIDRVIAYGADIIMLPMFETASQAYQFVEQVRGRTRTSLLLENKVSLSNIDAIVQVPGIDEIHVGLNDLRLSLGLRCIFEVLSLGILDTISEKIHQAGIRFGFGGVTSPQVANLPISPAYIIAEQVRLGSKMAFLGRSFRQPFEHNPDITRIKEAVAAIHDCICYWQKTSHERHIQNQADLRQAIHLYLSALQHLDKVRQ
jgi:hypothetical protein